jgi:hypothetical protein
VYSVQSMGQMVLPMMMGVDSGDDYGSLLNEY